MEHKPLAVYNHKNIYIHKSKLFHERLKLPCKNYKYLCLEKWIKSNKNIELAL